MSLIKSTRHILLITITAALLITACNVGSTPEPTVDVNALNTAVVGTTVAQLGEQLTQTAQAAPTNTVEPTEDTAPTEALPTLDISAAASATLDVSALPTFSFESTAAPTTVTVLDTPASGLPTTVVIPTNTSTTGGSGAQGDACDNILYLYDVTIPDGTVVHGGESFTKLWAVRNTGTCTWDDGYSLVVVAGDSAVGASNFYWTDNPNKTGDFVPGGTEKVIGAPVNAPCAPGDYQVHWKMKNDRGFYFGGFLSLYFTVDSTKVGGCP